MHQNVSVCGNHRQSRGQFTFCLGCQTVANKFPNKQADRLIIAMLNY